MNKKIIVAGIGLVGVLTLVVSLSLAQEVEGSLQIKGSDTMVNLGQAWAEAFMQKYPKTSVAVTGGGSGTGIAAILNGTCDIAQSSRDVSQKEQELAQKIGFQIREIQVGIDALAVIVHSDNPVERLTIDQLSEIFTSKITHWSQVGGSHSAILVLSRERNSGTHVYFLEHVVRRGNPKGPEEFAPSVLMMLSSQTIVEEVASRGAAIGYIGMGYLSDRVKAVAIAKDPAGPFILPTLEEAKKENYPVSRPLWFLTKGEAQGLGKAFIAFVLSDEGQKIVEEMDFIPLR